MKQSKRDFIREAAETNFVTFVRLVAPHLLVGSVHIELMRWMTRSEAKDNKLVLLPRGHMKSKLAAYYTAWRITKNPAITVLYVSATSPLAEKQLYQIKMIIDSPIYCKYWPDMIGKEEGKREKWAVEEIIVDHPRRMLEGVRDSTVKAVGITANITGFHADLVILDDLVVITNVKTEEGREKVRTLYSQLASVENPGAEELAVGTRYDYRDIYNTFITMQEAVYDSEGELIDEVNVYEVFERKVEDEGDGTGEFIWPRQQRKDGAYFGFDQGVLARIKAKYQDMRDFYSQYYNDPNAMSDGAISADKFQYYERSLVAPHDGVWFIKERKLNIYAAIDFAFSLKRTADYTAIVVVGVDSLSNYYVLDIDRFKTDGRISDYYKHILKAQQKWGFRKMRAEITVAQKAIVNELKDSYIKPNGLALSIDEKNPTRHEGDKHDRLMAILEPKYENMQIWHYEGGNCQSLEEELVLVAPPHDDVKEALANAIEISIAPKQWRLGGENSIKLNTHPRFGGVI